MSRERGLGAAMVKATKMQVVSYEGIVMWEATGNTVIVQFDNGDEMKMVLSGDGECRVYALDGTLVVKPWASNAIRLDEPMNSKPTKPIFDKYWQAVIDASAVLHDNSDGAFVVALQLAVDEAYAAGRAAALALYEQADVQRANAQNEAAMLRQQLAAVRGQYARRRRSWRATSTTGAAKPTGCCNCWRLTGRRANARRRPSRLPLDRRGTPSTACWLPILPLRLQWVDSRCVGPAAGWCNVAA